MTTREELGRMLVSGKPIQVKIPTTEGTEWIDDDTDNFDLDFYEYRYKPSPKLTYYRVYEDPKGRVEITRQGFAFTPIKDWIGASCKHLQDFEVEE